jgi:hypothetical protein
MQVANSLKQKLTRTLECGILPDDAYLAGGTAVYFYLHHRLSVDLDFFTPSPFSSEIFLDAIRRCFHEVTVELLGKETVIVYLGIDKLKFSLFRFPYKLLFEPFEMPIHEGLACPLAHLSDIAAMKAIAINQRGSIKDFIDLFFIVQKMGLDFGSLAALVTDKYQLNQGYDYQLKISFVYFDDAEKEMDQIVMIKDDAPQELALAEWEHVKAFYREFVK